MMQVKRVAIINQHSSNFGDDAAGVSLVDQLLHEFPHVQIDLIYKKKGPDGDLIPVTDKRVNHNEEIYLNERDLISAVTYLLLPGWLYLRLFPKSRIAQLSRILEEVDVVFVSPCGANIGKYRDKLFLFRLIVAVKTNNRVIFHLNSVGKSGSFWYDMLARLFVRRAKVFVRERKSAVDMNSWGIPCAIGTDTAFSMSLEKIAAADYEPSQGNFVAFVPTYSLEKWHPDFRETSLDEKFTAIHDALAQFAGQGRHRIVLIPHLHGREDEQRWLTWSCSELRARGVEAEVAANIRDPFSYAKALGGAELVVTMRYHGMVLAARTGRPFVGISYENKMAEVAHYCGMPEHLVDLQTVTTASLRNVLDCSMAQKDALVSVLIGRREMLERLARSPLDWLIAFGSGGHGYPNSI